MDLNRFLPYVCVVIATLLPTWHLWSLMKTSRSARYPESSDYHQDDEAEASSPSSSSSTPVREYGFQYDVFLSFRGPDTRNHFTGHLYDKLNDKGIVTFIDSERLEKGQKVKDLFECIRRSKIFVPIFSKGYADSKWCLKEIAAMVECKRPIMPVFFDVEPTDVRHQTGPFAQAFRRHRTNNNIDKEEVSKWRGALTKAGEVSGYNLADTNEDQAKLVRLIVKRILREVNKTTPLDVGKHPVGLDSRNADVMKLLDVEAEDGAKMVGIHALGGMGKTTLAKAVYNEISTRFDACSFISNVREVAKQPTGLVSLQKQLLYDVLNDEKVKVNSTDEGIGIIEKRIGSKKVLLVLDDVDHKSQLDALAGAVNWFSSGSRIIITTRDKKILTAQSVLNQYELKGLNDTQSLQLFSWHAFGKEEPNAEFAELSKEVTATAAGQPLALEIFGSHFFDLQTIKEWSDMLEMLKEDQEKDIHGRLRISFDTLNEKEKKVFLDIACFFIGKERKLATLMWEDCKFFPDVTINVLVHKSLVNINDKTREFEMHDHIRDMGRKIVQEESLSNPGMCSSRLWKDADETLDVLKDKREMKNVEAIQLFCCQEGFCRKGGPQIIYEQCISAIEELFTTMSQLRMFRLTRWVRLEARHFPSELTWLEWHPSDLDSLPDGRYLEKIVVLDLSSSSITQLWNPQTSARTKAFGKLKVLNLDECYNLTSCPDFKSMPHLLELNLGRCWKMSALHPSIWDLKLLTHLSLRNYGFKELPSEVWQLTSLEEFDLSNSREITALPLQKQFLLDKLKVLHLSCCEKLRTCPEFTGMPHLEILSFAGCREMSELHPSIGDLKRLTYLSLHECHSLNELPEQIWQLTALEVLDNHYYYDDYSKITERPSHLGDSEFLKQPFLGNKLEFLSLCGCKNITKCPDFTIIPHLERLDFSGCEKMSELHPSIGHLKGLTELDLSGCTSLKELPREIWQLTSFEQFDLSNGPQLTDFPIQLGDSKSFKQPSLGKLEVSNVAGRESHTTCPDFMSMLKFLTSLNLSGRILLKELPEEVGQLTSLESLDSCSQISTLPESMGHLKQLKWLSLSECSSLKEVPKCIVSLDMLEELIVACCVQLEFLPQLPPSLTALDAKGCHQLKIIENVSNLEPLCTLCLDDCERLVELPGIEKLKCLETLGLHGCRNLCNSFWEILQEAYFPQLRYFSISESRIECEPSSPQSLSFLLPPKEFEHGELYLYLEQGSMDKFFSKHKSEKDRYSDSIFSEEADICIPSDDEVTDPMDSQLDITADRYPDSIFPEEADIRIPSDDEVRIHITAEDDQCSISTLVVERDDELTATFERDSEPMKRARDICAAQGKTLMMIHVSIDGCILLHGDFFTRGYLDYEDSYFDKVGEKTVRVDFF